MNLMSEYIVSPKEIIFKRLQDLEGNHRILKENTRKLEEAKIYISVSECKKFEECTMTFFQSISVQDFELFLTPFTKRYILDAENYRDSFRIIFNESFSAEQAREFARRFSIYLLLKSNSVQKKLIDEFLEAITLDRLKAAAFPSLFEQGIFDEVLLNRILADSLVYPDLSNCKFSNGTSNTLRTIWKICIEDIDNFLEAFDTISQTPVNANEAMQFVHLYQMQMAIFAESGSGLPGGQLLLFVPFIMNAIRKLYMHYLQKTPSNLPPLLDYSDSNFYQGVAPVKNRDDILGQIYNAWQQELTPMLVGEPGCGKTSILIEVARRIHQRVFPGFSQDEEYKVYGGTATSLASAGGLFGGNSHIERILRKISDKREFAILLLDEIQGFNDAQKTLLKTYFDNNPKSVRYAVFATTTEGAKAFFEGDDGSLDRRFIRIIVPKFTSEETQYILHQQARSIASSLIVHPDVIDRIVKHANGEFAKSKKILFQVLRKALKKNQTSQAQEDYNQKTNELNLITTQHQKEILMGHHNPQLIVRMNQLNKEKKELFAHLQQVKLEIQHHEILVAKRTQLMYKILDISQEMLELFNSFVISKRKNLDELSPEVTATYFAEFKNQIDKLTKEFIYYNFFLNPMLCKMIKDFEEEHGFITEITNDFVTNEDLAI